MVITAYPYEMTAHLLVSGEDAADFLQSQFSNDLRPFSAGQCSYGLWLDAKGKIVADSWIYCEDEEHFRIYSEHSDGALIKDKLENHIVADEVEIDLRQPVFALAVIGGAPDETSATTGADCLLPGRRSLEPSHEVLLKNSAARQAFLDKAGMKIVSGEWIQAERMRSGIAAFNAEVLPGDMPEEGGLLKDAVSLNKGCFLGQEVVARMHNVGRPQRGLFLLSGQGDAPKALGPVENADGKVLGELRSSLAIDTGWRGVAMLKSRFVEPGCQVLACGESVIVEKVYG